MDSLDSSDITWEPSIALPSRPSRKGKQPFPAAEVGRSQDHEILNDQLHRQAHPPLEADHTRRHGPFGLGVGVNFTGVLYCSW
jgi:hypothetical protein